jgi:putative endonuclease
VNEAGRAAEALAAAHLERHGLEIVARNYRCRRGEVDLIAADGETLVFVEVRLRSRADFGGAAGSIDGAKQRRIAIAARHFLSRRRAVPPCRFDAVLLTRLDERAIEWIRGAFALS